MSQSYLKQTDTALYPDLMWSRPETKHGAGKLLIIGGQAQEFLHVAEGYAASENAGAGTIRVFLPESTRKVTKMLPNIEYSEANNSGSFAKAALADLLDAADWSDGVLLAGDLGKNSETTLMLESLIAKYPGLLVITSNALASLAIPASTLFAREQTCLVITLDELQKFGIDLKLERPIVSTIGDVELADILREISSNYTPIISLKRGSKIWVAVNGNVAVAERKKEISLLDQAGRSAVWILQHPAKPFESGISAVFE